MAINLLATMWAVMATFWIELAFLVCFSLGFVFLRSRRVGKAGQLKSKCSHIASKPSREFSQEVRTRIEEEAEAERWPNVLEAWRGEQYDAQTPKDLLKPITRAFLEVDPDALAKEMIFHVRKHWHGKVFGFEYVGLTVLDVVARSGKTNLMSQLWEGLPRDRGSKYSSRLYDVLLGGFATAGQADKVKSYEAMMRRERLRLSPRGFSLIIKGYLKNNFVDEVFEKLLQMQQCGYQIPSFAMAQFFRIASEASRSKEFFTVAIENFMDISVEGYVVLLEDGARTGDVDFVEQVEKSVRSTYRSVPSALAEIFVRVHMTNDQAKAIAIFKQVGSETWNESAIVRLLARCAENKFLSFAEEMIAHCQEAKVMTLSIYSAMMKVYAFCGLYHKACDLYRSIEKDGIEPDSMMYGCLMKFAMECGRTSFLNSLARKVPQLDIQHYMTMIRSAGAQHDVDRAFAIFEEMKKNSAISPDIAIFNSLLDVCCRAGHMERAKRFTEEMRRSGMIDSISYNTLIKGLIDSGDVSSAKQTMKEMAAAGIPANDVSYNCLINSAVKMDKLSEAWDLVRALESQGLTPDCYTVSTMMKTLKKPTPPGHFEKCFDLLGRSGVDLCQDEILLNIVLETTIRHKDFERIKWTLDRFEESKLRPSTPTYGSLIKACGILKRVKQCWKLWNEMTQLRGLQPTQIVVGCMLDALVCNGLVDYAEQIFYEHSNPPNVILYSILIKGFATTHQPKRAMDLWRAMRKLGLKMNTVGYNSVLDSQARQGNMEEVSEILKAMEEEAVKPDGVTHSIIVKAYCVRSEFQKALQAIRSMQASNVEHDAVVYNTCLDSLSKHGKLDLMEKLLKDMIGHGILPTNFTLGIMVKACGRAKQLEKAFVMMEELPKLGKFKPNHQVWMSLMLTCINNDASQKAMEVFQEMQTLGHTVDARGYQVLLKYLIKSNSLAEAVVLVDEAFGLRTKKSSQSAGCDVKRNLDGDSLEALFAAIAHKDLRQELALPLLHRLRAAQIPVSSKMLACALEA